MLTDSTSARRGPWLVALVVLVLGLLLRPLAAHAEPAPVLSPAQQLALARMYAPTLVFHPQERYFPTNPRPSDAGDGTLAAWSSRVEQYRDLTTPEKLQRAALAYRVFTRMQDRHLEVVIE